MLVVGYWLGVVHGNSQLCQRHLAIAKALNEQENQRRRIAPTVPPPSPIQPIQPIQPAQPIQPIQPAQSIQPTQPIQSFEELQKKLKDKAVQQAKAFGQNPITEETITQYISQIPPALLRVALKHIGLTNEQEPLDNPTVQPSVPPPYPTPKPSQDPTDNNTSKTPLPCPLCHRMVKPGEVHSC